MGKNVLGVSGRIVAVLVVTEHKPPRASGSIPSSPTLFLPDAGQTCVGESTLGVCSQVRSSLSALFTGQSHATVKV